MDATHPGLIVPTWTEIPPPYGGGLYREVGGSVSSRVNYHLDSLGYMHLRGWLDNNPPNLLVSGTICVVPNPPAKRRIYWSERAGTTMHRVDVLANGNVDLLIASSGGNWTFVLSGIVWPVA